MIELAVFHKRPMCKPSLCRYFDEYLNSVGAQYPEELRPRVFSFFDDIGAQLEFIERELSTDNPRKEAVKIMAALKLAEDHLYKTHAELFDWKEELVCLQGSCDIFSTGDADYNELLGERDQVSSKIRLLEAEKEQFVTSQAAAHVSVSLGLVENPVLAQARLELDLSRMERSTLELEVTGEEALCMFEAAFI